VLVEVVARVGKTLRTEDILSRYGGEEFAIIVRGADLEAARQLAERVREVCHMKFPYAGRAVDVSLSIGVATLGCCPSRGPEELIAIADRRLYAAKRGGRNRVNHTD
jgi:diguanylate cyclase (GGDEF)-like protein